MNQPKDYVPLYTFAELEAHRVERQARFQRWTDNALLFMAGVATGMILFGTIAWGF